MKKNNLDKNKIIKRLMTILFIYFPVLDILRGTPVKDIQFLGIAIIELFNFLLIGISLIFTFLKIDKRKFIKLFLYIILVGVYLLFHYYHIINFDTNIFKEANFNLIVECYYIIRVYILPVLALFILTENKDIFDKNYYFTVLKVVITFISLSIIILNITKLSYLSYSATHETVKYSILDYFFNDIKDYRMLLCRGWFDSANELSAILFGLLPLNIFLLFKEKQFQNVFLLIFQVMAMIILGTRTSAMGSILVCIATIIIYLFLCLIKAHKLDKDFLCKFCIPVIFLVAFYYVSPFYQYRSNESDSYLKTTISDEIKNAEANLQGREALITFIYEHLYDYRIAEDFAELYPIENDLDWWVEICRRELRLNNNSRQMKMDILGRVQERNDNKLDKYLGLGYTLNFMDIERDYVYQYYLFGTIGIILFLGIYFIFYIKNIINTLKDLKNKFKLEIALAFMGPCLIFIIAYASGHVFGWVSPMMYLTFTLAFLNLNVGGKYEKN